MISRKLFLLLSVFFLFACNGEKRRMFKNKTKPAKPFVFNMQHYFSDLENQVSFPVWFNDSVIKKHQVKSLTRSIYPNKTEDESSLPKVVKKYLFAEDGSLSQINVKRYYESVLVEDVTIDYEDKKDEAGFSKVSFSNAIMEDGQRDQYQVYEKEKYSDRFLVYSDEETGDYLFYMLNEEHWGALSVDTILQPTPEDWIVLGTPGHPIKKYKVFNTVTEKFVTDYGYRKSDDAIVSIKFEKYPFYYRRYITYSEQGDCNGYVDSTFSGEDYLTRTVSTFQMGENKLPVKLQHKKEGEGDYEVFEYEYFEE